MVEQRVFGKGGHRASGQGHHLPQGIGVARDLCFLKSRAHAFGKLAGIQGLGGEAPGLEGLFT